MMKRQNTHAMLRYLPLLLLVLLSTCDRAAQKSAATPADQLTDPPRHQWPTERPIRLILDADTANEIDDLYAIAYALPDATIDLLGLSSAQWFHVWSGDSTVYQSQRLNEELLSLAGYGDLPHPLGADLMMGKPWGDYDARDSPAARFIIAQAQTLPPGEKLVVMCIGAATNLASALALEPAISEKIVAYVLGFQYDFAGKFWNKDEFNIRRDLNAANYLLNNEQLELHVMPTSVAIQYKWPQAETFAQLDQSGPVGAYLKQKWLERFPDANEWVMWDVALVQALLNPAQASEIAVQTPPENTRRMVWMYDSIDAAAMERDFWQRLTGG